MCPLKERRCLDVSSHTGQIQTLTIAGLGAANGFLRTAMQDCNVSSRWLSTNCDNDDDDDDDDHDDVDVVVDDDFDGDKVEH